MSPPMSPSRPWHPILLALACSAWLAAADEARERPLNEGWRFLRGDPADAFRPDCDDRAWRTVDLPHDWSIEDLPTREQDGQFATIDLVPGTWRFQPGDDAAWSRTVCDDGAWRTAILPEPWDRHGQTGGGTAVGWYRRGFSIPASAAGKQVIITLGRIHDQDVTHVDGIKVGASGEGYWSSDFRKSRCYVLPAHLATPGDHVVAVRVTGGKDHAGGIVAAVEAPAGPSPCDPGRSAGGINTGYAVGGVGWYRTTCTLTAAEADRQVRLVFDGAYMHTTVWCNGAEERLTTAGPAAALRLSTDRSAIPAARDGLAFVTVEVVDARGIPVPHADPTIGAAITGNARLAAFGNGDPTDVASVQDARHRLWRGRGLIVVRSTGVAGDSTCTVTAPGLAPASVRITHR